MWFSSWLRNRTVSTTRRPARRFHPQLPTLRICARQKQPSHRHRPVSGRKELTRCQAPMDCSRRRAEPSTRRRMKLLLPICSVMSLSERKRCSRAADYIGAPSTVFMVQEPPSQCGHSKVVLGFPRLDDWIWKPWRLSVYCRGSTHLESVCHLADSSPIARRFLVRWCPIDCVKRDALAPLDRFIYFSAKPDGL